MDSIYLISFFSRPLKFIDSIIEDIIYNFPFPRYMSDKTNTQIEIKLLHMNVAEET